MVKVTLFEALCVPTCWSPNDKLLAERDANGEEMPVPEREIVSEGRYLKMKVRVAVRGPVVVGAK